MPEQAIKRRMSRAKQKAEKDLQRLGFKTVPSNNKPVCLVAINRDGVQVDVRIIRICLDEIKPIDKKSLSGYDGLHRELWIRKEGSENFEIHKV